MVMGKFHSKHIYIDLEIRNMVIKASLNFNTLSKNTIVF